MFETSRISNTCYSKIKLYLHDAGLLFLDLFFSFLFSVITRNKYRWTIKSLILLLNMSTSSTSIDMKKQHCRITLQKYNNGLFCFQNMSLQFIMESLTGKNMIRTKY